LCALVVFGSAAAARTRHLHRHHDLVRGIDVSHYQGRINWRGVASDRVAFAYVKATEGVSGRDSRFASNWQGARRAGLRVGAYHYFIFCRSPRAQARNFLAVAPRSARGLAPAVDLEPSRSCPGGLRGPEVRRELTAYLAIVEARQHRRAVLYVTPQFYAAYGRDLPRRVMWRRSTLAAAPTGSWAVWQFGSRGRVDGIRTRVDLNLARVSAAL
jgi:lysozyme